MRSPNSYLREMKVTSVGHVIRILKEIDLLRSRGKSTTDENNNGKEKNYSTIPVDTIQIPINSSLASEATSITMSHESDLHLPEETLLHIFSYLRYPDLISCSCVSKLWNQVSKDPSLVFAFNML
jgi:hypothetical protein